MVVTRRIKLTTQGHADIIDITAEVSREIGASGLKSGTVTLFAPSSTSALTTAEFESGVVHDLRGLFDRLIPPDIEYRHNLRWRDGNGHSHARHALLGPSLVVPFVDGRMTLGTWQQILFIDFDNRPRSRTLIVQVMGE